MLNNISSDCLFTDYYSQWISIYKEGAIRRVTLAKYKMTHSWLKKLIPSVKIKDVNRIVYQQLLNDYASEHE